METMIDSVKVHKIVREYLEIYGLNDRVELQPPIFRHGDNNFYISCLVNGTVVGQFIVSAKGRILDAPLIEDLC